MEKSTRSFVRTAKTWFPAIIRERGDEYYREGNVEPVKSTATQATFKVSGSTAYTVNVGWRIDNTQVHIHRMDCTCPFSQSGDGCKHLWASLVYLEHHLFPTNSGELSPTSLVEESGESSKWRKYLSEIAGPEAATAAAATPQSIAAQEAKIEREIFFGINFKESEQKQKLVLVLCGRKFYKSREPDPITPLALKLYSSADLAKLSLEDQKWIDFMDPFTFDSIYSYSINKYGVSGDFVEIVLRTLQQAGKLVFIDPAGKVLPSTEQPILEFITSDAQLQLELCPSEDGAASVRVDLSWRADEDFFSLEDLPSYAQVSALRKDRLLIGNKVVHLTCPSHLGWLQKWSKREKLNVPFSQMKNFLADLRSSERNLLSGVRVTTAKLQAEAPSSFIPKAYIDYVAGSGIFRCDMLFDYDGYEIQPNEPLDIFWSEKQQRLGKRDFAKETEILKGLTPPFNIEMKDVQEFAQELLEKKWTVFVEKQKTPQVQTGTFKWRVKTGVDWFDVELTVNGQALDTKQLNALIRNGRQANPFVSLKDGSRVMLSKEQLDQVFQMNSLARLDDDGLHIAKNQFILIDHLLSSFKDSQIGFDFDDSYLNLQKLSQSHSLSDTWMPIKAFKGELRDYQAKGVSWLQYLKKMQLGGILADDMGLGKTIQVLALLAIYREANDSDRKLNLIVVPKSLIDNWVREIERFTPDMKVLAVSGQGRLPLYENFPKVDIVVTTFHTLRIDIERYEKLEFNYMIIDEAQNIKNSSAQVSKAVKSVRASHRIALSGTPIENSIWDLHSIMSFVNPGLLTKDLIKKSSEDAFLQDQFLRALRPLVLRRIKKDVLKELPEKTEQIIYCEMEPEQQELYTSLLHHYRNNLLDSVAVKGLGKSKMLVLEALLRLRQIACHPSLAVKKKEAQAYKSGKVLAFIEQIRDATANGHKCLVFSQFTSFLEIISKELQAIGISYLYLDGSTKNRLQLVDDFNESKDNLVFLLSLKAGGVGLNLTSADFVFLLDPWWNPAAETQAIDRAHRIGQDSHVFAYRMITKGTVEEKILELQKKKKDLADLVLNESPELMKKLSEDDLQFLFSM